MFRLSAERFKPSLALEFTKICLGNHISPLTWRELQAQALDFLVEYYSKFNDIFVEAPTGIGKSAIAIALALWLAARGQRTFISTTTVALEQQYMRDFRPHGLRQLHAKRHYRCEQWGTCDLGSTMIRTGERAYKRCQADPCTYQVAKGAFMALGPLDC